MQKIEKFKASFCYKKTHFVSLFPQNPRARFSPKKSFESILILFANITSCKNQKSYSLTNDNIEKSHLESILDHFWPRNVKARFFTKGFFMSISNLHGTVTLCTKSEKFLRSIFHKT